MRSGACRRRGGRAALWLVVGLLVGGLAGAGAMYAVKRGKAGPPGGPRLGEADELSLVPGTAAGFVHIRLRAIWDTENFAEVRKIIDKAGPQARAAIDEGFVPAPSSIDRMTFVVLKTSEPAKSNPPPKGGIQPVPKGGFQPVPPQPKGGFQPPPQPPGAFPDLEGFIPPIATDDVKVVVILAFKEPFKEEQVRANHLPDGVKKNHAGKDYWEDGDLAAYYHSDTALVMGDPAGMKAYLTKLSQGSAGPLSAAVAHARDGGRHVVAALNVAQFGIEPRMFDKMTDGAPEEYKAAAKDASTVLKLECLSVGVAVAEETRIDVRAKYKDDDTARDAEEAMRNLAKFARTKLDEQSFKKDMQAAVDGKPGAAKPRPIKELPEAVGALFGLGGLNSLDEWLADPPLSRDGSEVVLTPKVPSLTAAYAGMTAASIGFLLPATQKVRDSASRMKDSNNLKQIALAMHNYHDATGALPPPDGTTGVKVKSLLSWRVHMLPYIEGDNLYRQFKLDEPWDSATNKKLIDQMPLVYASPLAADPVGQTRYKVFVGGGAAFERGRKLRIADFTDGTSNTILVAGGGSPVVWTKPDDIEFTGTVAPSALALPGKTGCNVTMADGSVRWIELSRVTPDALKGAITRAGGEVPGLDW